VVEALDRLVPVEEPGVSALIRGVLAAEGVAMHAGTAARRVDHDGGGFRAALGDGGEVTGQRLLVSTGRRADLIGLGVDTVGLDPAARAVEVDDRMRAGDRLWAVGDVTGRARSPTWPCTRPASRCGTSSGRTVRVRTPRRRRG
jgi:pyruvate/2-oxoglutarate dehydrogenase complex dihydrolipoamide dehydrogenase (E3) component